MASFGGDVDLCIVTIVQNEFQAVQKVLKHVTGFDLDGPKDCFKKGTTELAVSLYYVEWKGFFNDDKDRPLKIAIVSPVSMGRENTAQLISNISHTTLNPSVITMVGVCAGFGEKVNLGDILVPFRITRDSGKRYESGERAVDAEYVELSSDMEKIVKPVADGGECRWIEQMPALLKDAPSPVYLQDFILSKLNDSVEVNLMDVLKKLDEEHSQWTLEGKGVVSDEAIETAVAKLEEEGFIIKSDKDSNSVHLSITEQGKLYVKKHTKTSLRGKAVFPVSPRTPIVHTDNVYSGDIVDEAIDYKRLATEVGQRKLIGYEMEGYAFLHSVRDSLKSAKALFAKGVSDLGTRRSKMDYYQCFCAASAAAFICSLIKGRSFLFPRKSPSNDVSASGSAGSQLKASSSTTKSSKSKESEVCKSLPPDDEEVDDALANSVADVAAAYCDTIALHLNIDASEFLGKNKVRLKSVIEAWKRGSKKKPTVRMLIFACEKAGVARRIIAGKYVELVASGLY